MITILFLYFYKNKQFIKLYKMRRYDKGIIHNLDNADTSNNINNINPKFNENENRPTRLIKYHNFKCKPKYEEEKYNNYTYFNNNDDKQKVSNRSFNKSKKKVYRYNKKACDNGKNYFHLGVSNIKQNKPSNYRSPQGSPRNNINKFKMNNYLNLQNNNKNESNICLEDYFELKNENINNLEKLKEELRIKDENLKESINNYEEINIKYNKLINDNKELKEQIKELKEKIRILNKNFKEIFKFPEGLKETEYDILLNQFNMLTEENEELKEILNINNLKEKEKYFINLEIDKQTSSIKIISQNNELKNEINENNYINEENSKYQNIEKNINQKIYKTPDLDDDISDASFTLLKSNKNENDENKLNNNNNIIMKIKIIFKLLMI